MQSSMKRHLRLICKSSFIRPCCRPEKSEFLISQCENWRNGSVQRTTMILNGNNDRQGVIKTPCRFYFGCYIDTLCGRALRNRMSGAVARHFFFLEKVRTVSACIGINLPLKERPAIGGEQPTPPWRRWRKHSVCMTNALAGARPSPQCRLRAEDFAAVPRERRAICPEKHT